MKNFKKYATIIIIITFLLSLVWQTEAVETNINPENFKLYFGDFVTKIDTPPPTNDSLPFPFKEDENYFDGRKTPNSKLYMEKPSNVTQNLEYDPETNQYIIKNKIGDIEYQSSESMDIDDYLEYDFDKSVKNYWKEKASGQKAGKSSSWIPQLAIDSEVFERVFGKNTIDIKPQGSAELTFGIDRYKTENPNLDKNLQTSTMFNFDEKIQMSVMGKIGDKVELGIKYDTEASFEFENKTKLAYQGKEDEIIQLIEAGDVTLPLTGTLITGAHSLFGIKTKLKFGNLMVTSILSRQKGETSVIEVEGGAQINDFEIYADNYEANKHFFLSHYFVKNYDDALKDLPLISSSITIQRVEVWVTNKMGNFEDSRNIVAFSELAEVPRNQNGELPSVVPLPNNDVNNFYETVLSRGIREVSQVTSNLSGFYEGGKDYEKIENARKLSSSEYKLDPQLGFISLNSSLNSDEVLAVAYEYTIANDTVIYKIGELSNSGVPANQNLVLKLLKGTYFTPKLSTWDLMLKNVYAIGAYQVDSKEFFLNVMYQDDKTGSSINYLPVGDIKNKVLLEVLNLDNVNSQLDPYPDGQFDFINGVTINSSNGRIFFPVLEPFGSYLKEKINNDAEAERYIFQELYDSIQSDARQIAKKNKFFLQGTYKSSSSSEIYLGAFNIPDGSVVVTAGGRKLIENQDYVVDYNLGRVSIINTGLLESGTTIRISMESNSMFNIVQKTLLGTHLDYKISDNFNLGATILNLTEKPLTTKVNAGDEPISNTIWGVDGMYRTEAPFLTKMVDALPFLDTKEESDIIISGEFAQLIPGHSDAVGDEGVAYIDDFEGTNTSIDLKQRTAWSLSSTPQMQKNMFPEAELTDSLLYGFNRSLLSWYTIENLFQRTESNTPSYIKDDADFVSSHFVREILEKEIFPNKESKTGMPVSINTLDLTYRPTEIGPYNYDTDNLSEDGHFTNPRKRWAGIMREVPTNDFETANIEFIEFWIMDPFVEDEDSSNIGGDLYFNLGNISEDILKDGRKSLEHGLPTSSEITNVDTSVWGRISTRQPASTGFDNDPDKRQFQDIGFDGLNDDDERLFFQDYLSIMQNILNAEAFNKINNDPSKDNYVDYLSENYDGQRAEIVERYKFYNGLENNSPTSSNATTPTTLPDVEDINRDNTLSENESYFQYKVSLRRDDMKIGNNYITDKISYKATFKNKQKSSVTWYQFKIPIQKYMDKFGPIQDFKSIRFIRMFLHNFEETTILRFGSLDLIRSEWRKYELNLVEGNEGLAYPQNEQGSFDVSAVNIEENGTKEPVNYVLPPGISRETDPTNTIQTLQNEQSIVLKVIDLPDGDARAVYKTLDMDIRQYKRLKMEIHAEEIIGYPLEDDELRAFIRFGSDYTQNYYEYEVSLKITPEGRYDDSNGEDRLKVWPSKNRIDFELGTFQDVKQERNSKMRESNSNVSLTIPYVSYDNNNRVIVMGNPNLSNVRTVMLGIRNPHKNKNENDDGFIKSGEIWMNELRLSDFDEEGGWAANARISMNLADFATVSFSGSTSKAGFGSIEKKVNERSKEEINTIDMSANLQLGKFFPEKYGVSVPMYLAYSRNVKNPKYNPLDPDVLLEDALDEENLSSEDRDKITHNAQDFTEKKSINFSNVKIRKIFFNDKKENSDNKTISGKDGKAGGMKPSNRGGKGGGARSKPQLYDISNWSFSYGYNETYIRNPNTEYNKLKNYFGAINYNFNTRPKNITPLKKIKFLRKPSLRIIRDFNFYYMPKQVSFTTDMDRRYNEIKLRNISNPDLVIRPMYDKDFTWNRIYNLKYDLTKTIKIDYSATNTARIDEPIGRIDKDDFDYEEKRDTIWENIKSFGRTTEFHQKINVSYNVPINKILFLNWVNLSLRYSGTYNWLAGPIYRDRDLGNEINNTQRRQGNLNLNFLNLYNKSKYLKALNRKYRRSSRKKPKPKIEHVEFKKENVNLKANIPKTIKHNLKTEDVEIKVLGKNKKEIIGIMQIKNENKVTFKVDKNYKNVNVEIIGRRKAKEDILKKIIDRTVFTLMATKNMSFTYSENMGIILPGYVHSTDYFGLQQPNEKYAPGIPFVFGWNDKNFPNMAAENDWITTDTMLNSQFLNNYGSNLNFKTTIEPVKDFRIDLTASRQYSENVREYWVSDNDGNFKPTNTRTLGNFSMSFSTFRTAFWSIDDDYNSKAFDDFKNNRIIIAERMAKERPRSSKYNPDIIDPETNFPDGYGPNSQDVLLSSFLSAYAGKNAKDFDLDNFPAIPIPNWRINYNGLSKVEFFKKYLKTVNISHAYRCTYNVGGYENSLDFKEEEDGFSYVRNTIDTMGNGNFVPQNLINSVTINEQISPIAGIDITWKNLLSTKFEFKKTRNLTLNFTNNQIIEVRNNEYVFGVGYRFKSLAFNIKVGGSQKQFKSDLNTRIDFSIRDNVTIIRKIEEDQNEATAGQKIITLKVAADYNLGDSFVLRFFIDNVINDPKISNSYRTVNTKVGFSVRFNLINI